MDPQKILMAMGDSVMQQLQSSPPPTTDSKAIRNTSCSATTLLGELCAFVRGEEKVAQHPNTTSNSSQHVGDAARKAAMNKKSKAGGSVATVERSHGGEEGEEELPPWCAAVSRCPLTFYHGFLPVAVVTSELAAAMLNMGGSGGIDQIAKGGGRKMISASDAPLFGGRAVMLDVTGTNVDPNTLHKALAPALPALKKKPAAPPPLSVGEKRKRDGVGGLEAAAADGSCIPVAEPLADAATVVVQIHAADTERSTTGGGGGCERVVQLIHEVVGCSHVHRVFYCGGSVGRMFSVIVVAHDAHAAAGIASALQVEVGEKVVVRNFSSTGGKDGSSNSYFSSLPAHDRARLVVAAFCYEAVALLPVVLPAEGLEQLLRCWYAAYSVRDVAAGYCSLALPPRPAATATDTDTKCDGEEQVEVEEKSRREQFTRELLEEIYAHAQQRPSPYVAQVTTFFTLYEALCLGRWSLLLKKSSDSNGEEDGNNNTNTTTQEGGGLRPSFYAAAAAAHQAKVVVADVSHMRFKRRKRGGGGGFGLVPDEGLFPPMAAPRVSLAAVVLPSIFTRLKPPPPLLLQQQQTDEQEKKEGEKIENSNPEGGGDGDGGGPPFDFYSSSVSDAMRVLYCLEVEQQQCKSSGGRGAAFVGFGRLAATCCDGSDERLLRAVKELRQSKLVVVNYTKKVMRCIK